MLLWCWVLFIFGKKRNKTWGKDVLSKIIDNPTDWVATIEGFVNNKERAETAIDSFVGEENDDWEIFF